MTRVQEWHMVLLIEIGEDAPYIEDEKGGETLSQSRWKSLD